MASEAHAKDPVWRFFLGCASAVAVLVGIVILGALIVGWRLARDPAPGRPVETFLVGDEARYWRVALEPGDAGLEAFFARLNEINEATRRNVLRGTFLESLPLPNRGARLAEFAPFTFELSSTASDDAPGLPLPTGWAARGTFSKGLWRVRAALRVMRFVAGRHGSPGGTQDVDGIPVTEIHDKGAGFAVAAVGNRVLVASDATRLRTVLRTEGRSDVPAHPELLALHDSIKLEGEDAWAFYSARRPGGLTPPLAEGGALASFDLNENDELAFRVAISPGRTLEGEADFSGDPADCALVVSRFLPGVPANVITIDGEGARSGAGGSREFSGRITGLSTRLAELLSLVTERRRQERPSASPSPSFPQPPSDPQSGSLGEPTHEGTPTPQR